MAMRRKLRLLAAVVLLAGLTVLVPGTPLYLPNLLDFSGSYEGRSARSWLTALDSPDADLRRRAAQALGAIGGPEGERAVPALANAVFDALKPLNVRKIEMPYTPHRVWRAIQDAQGSTAD